MAFVIVVLGIVAWWCFYRPKNYKSRLPPEEQVVPSHYDDRLFLSHMIIDYTSQGHVHIVVFDAKGSNEVFDGDGGSPVLKAIQKCNRENLWDKGEREKMHIFRQKMVHVHSKHRGDSE